MATVPRVTRTIDTAALPSVRTRRQMLDYSPIEQAQENQARATRQFGAAMGQIGEVVNKEVQAAIEYERDKADQNAALEYDNGLTAWATKRVYDPKDGALQKKGQDALGLPEQVMGEFDAHANELEKKLTNDRQRAAAARIRAQQSQNLDMTLRRHTLGEVQRYETDTLNASIENHANAAILARTDPARVASELAIAHAAIDTQGARLGIPPEERDNKKKAVASAVYSGVVEGLLTENKIPAARAYFEETKDQLNPQALERVQKALKEGTIRDESQKKADELLAAHPGDLAAQREQAKKIADPDVRQATLQQLEHEDAVRERLEQDRMKTARTNAMNLLDQSGGNLRAIPAATWAGFDGETRGALFAYAERKVRGIPVETDPQAYYELVQKATSPDPEVRAKFYNPKETNLIGYASRLSKSDLQQFMDVQTKGALQLENSQRSMLVSANNQNRIVDEALMAMGMDPTPKQAPGPNASPKEKQAYSQDAVDRVVAFRRAVRENVAQLESEQKKQATDAQVQEIVDKLRLPAAKKLIEKNTWSADVYRDQFAYEVKRFEDIPLETREQIKRQIYKAGGIVTPEKVVDAYRRLLKGTPEAK